VSLTNGQSSKADAAIDAKREASAEPTHVLRCAAFDIETTSLNGTYGRLLCACFKFSDDDEVITVRSRWMQDEPEALRKTKTLWDCADIVATWNGKRFDVPFINARLMHYGMEPLTHQKMHMDLMYQQRKLRFCGARLDNASKDLQANYAKYQVPGFRWPWAAQGDEEALNEIVHHCELDVLLTEEMFTKLRPLILRITK
jgi:uncharacterized protein YprB with RNaseH-like and TPR domain